MKAHEKIQIFYKKQPVYNKQLTEGKPYRAVNGGKKSTDCYGNFKIGYFKSMGDKRNPITVLKFNRERGLHPTKKPVALLEYLVKTYTNEGDTVLDNCMVGQIKVISVQKYKGGVRLSILCGMRVVRHAPVPCLFRGRNVGHVARHVRHTHPHPAPVVSHRNGGNPLLRADMAERCAHHEGERAIPLAQGTDRMIMYK